MKMAKKEVNPHAFIDPKVGEKMIKNITKSLSERNPKNKDYYKENEKAYLKNYITSKMIMKNN